MNKSQFLSTISNRKWMMHPQMLISYGHFLAGLVNGSILLEEEKKPLSGIIAKPTGERVKMYFDEQQDSSEEERPPSIFDEYPEGSVLILPQKGVMLKEDTWWSYGTETIGNYLRQAADHKHIAAAIMETDSGGGAVDSISPMVDATIYAKRKMPVVALADLSASAAYYINSAATEIIAGNDISSEFGSIGVMVDFWDISPYWEELGFKHHVIYAPESENKNDAWENALKGNYELMKTKVLSPLAKKFQNDVRSFRSGKVDITQKGILNGKMYYANDAIKYGLADSLGNMDFAIKRAIELANNY